MVDLPALGRRAKEAAHRLATTPTDRKNAALRAIAGALEAAEADILAANAADVVDGQAAGLTDAMIDRLTLTPARLAGIWADVQRVAELPDPVGETFEAGTLPNGLRVSKRRTPLGVLGVIYESRPNVTVDVAALALKSGNAAIMRGGSETLRSNRVLVEAIRHGLAEAGLPEDAVVFIDDPDRAHVLSLLRLHDSVDMIIPRGGVGLHRFCRENATIPVITGGIGVCHLFVDESADLSAALDVVQNAKVQRPTVCNALDTLLVHRAVAADFLPQVVERLQADGVTFRAEPEAMSALNGEAGVTPADAESWDTEWLSLVLGLKVVDGLDEALAHIRAHSTGHSDGILTTNDDHATRFVNEVDSAAVYVNASTRFTDGSQLGLGAEVAISTQKLHARGPMALRELTTYKWIIIGEGHTRP